MNAHWGSLRHKTAGRPESSCATGGIAGPSVAAARPPVRLHEIDGIRGWAALAVVVFHVFYECFGAVFPVFRNPFTHVFNGMFAVYVFFVLSGEALSASYFAGGGTRAVASLAVKRHSRLSIPIFASVVLLWGLQQAGLVFSGEASAIVQRPDWLGLFATAPLSLEDCLTYAALHVYLTSVPSEHVIPFLWTMSAEMIGSIFVFAVLGVWGALRRTGLLLGVAVMLLVSFEDSAFLAAFLSGLLLGSARQDGLIERLRDRPFAQPGSAVAIALVLALIYALPLHQPRSYTLAAMALVAAISVNRSATAFFRAPVSRFLGRLSFPLYLTHIAVIVSLTSGLIVQAADAGRLDVWTAFAIGVASIVAAIAVAMLFEPVEWLTKRAGDLLSARFVTPRATDAAKEKAAGQNLARAAS